MPKPTDDPRAAAERVRLAIFTDEQRHERNTDLAAAAVIVAGLAAATAWALLGLLG